MICGYRVKETSPRTCPTCTGEMQNLGNPREQ
nr:rubrerythrin-like domain-containing protein [Natronorubrum halalkaliphilum]